MMSRDAMAQYGAFVYARFGLINRRSQLLLVDAMRALVSTSQGKAVSRCA